MLKKRCFFIGLAGCLALADQWSKHFIQSHWVLYQPDEIWPFLNITLHYNTGIAFSFLNNLGSWQRWILSAVSAGLSVLILVWLYRLPKEKTLLPWALASILGGALGNLWDRITVGYVVDFIDLHVAGWHFAVFNLADTFISLGAVILFFELWFQPKR